jgi:hypothetical protein
MKTGDFFAFKHSDYMYQGMYLTYMTKYIDEADAKSGGNGIRMIFENRTEEKHTNMQKKRVTIWKYG